MNKIEEQLKKFKAIDIDSLLDECIEETEGILLNLIKSQLEIGKKGDGNALQDYRSDSYADFKKRVVGSLAPIGTPDLKLTGDFYEGFFQQTNLLGIDISSKDNKTSKLESKYGSAIFDITDENLIYYSRQVIYPKLMVKIRKELNY